MISGEDGRRVVYSSMGFATRERCDADFQSTTMQGSSTASICGFSCEGGAAVKVAIVIPRGTPVVSLERLLQRRSRPGLPVCRLMRPMSGRVLFRISSSRWRPPWIGAQRPVASSGMW